MKCDVAIDILGLGFSEVSAATRCLKQSWKPLPGGVGLALTLKWRLEREERPLAVGGALPHPPPGPPPPPHLRNPSKSIKVAVSSARRSQAFDFSCIDQQQSAAPAGTRS
jgi:hypothetical protein